MPCRMDDMPSSPSPDLAKENAKLKKTCDKLTRLLCEACEMHESPSHDLVFSKELEKWWENHKEVDTKRQAKENIKNQIARLQKELEELK